jgi:NADH-quinone oxidoreductase subunit N
VNLPSAISLWTLLPESILAIGACLVLVLGTLGAGARRFAPGLTLISILVATGLVFWKYQTADDRGAGYDFGSVAYFVRISALVVGVLLTLAAWKQAQEGEEGEYYSMLLFSLTGLLLIAPANNLVMLFGGIELVSIPTYVMVTLSRTNLRALEAGAKYFYLGALSAALLAYGLSFLYGVAGTISLNDAGPAIRAALNGYSGEFARGLAVVGVFVTLAGLFFKVAAAPLHFYIADVYQGAAHSVAGLLGFVPKLAGFVAIFKILAVTNVWTPSGDALYWLIWVVAAVSMTIGNVLALLQNNLKRMLAYSGVAHSGYMLVAVLAGPGGADYGTMGNGLAAVLYYAVVYGIANLAAFVVLGVLRFRGQTCENLREIGGLVRREPALALLLAFALLTLMGLPPTPGFWGKLSLFGSAISVAQANDARATSMIVLVIIAVLNTAVGAAYYLRAIGAALLLESEETSEADPAAEWPSMGALMCGVLLLIFSFYPNALLMSGMRASLDGSEISRVAAAPTAGETTIAMDSASR